MSAFVKDQLGFFERGRAFYEFKRGEDVVSYREVLHVPCSWLHREDKVIDLLDDNNIM